MNVESTKQTSASLKDRVAIVTGATGNLGRAAVRKLLERGVRVIAAYREESKFRALADMAGALASSLTGIQADVTDEASVQRLVEEVVRKFGRVDILLNIAGAYRGGRELSQTPLEDWNFLMDVNLKSAFICAKAVLPLMEKTNYGRIVSVAARPAVDKRGRAKSGAYAVSKAGVIVLTETLAEEVKKFNITVNCVLPSTIDSPENRRSFPTADFSKWVSPDDIAAVLLFLVSDDSAVASGAAIPVYGKA